MKPAYPSFLTTSLFLIAIGRLVQSAPTPGHLTDIPPSILTPNAVETRLVTLEFFDGYPSPETVGIGLCSEPEATGRINKLAMHALLHTLRDRAIFV